ncbi:MAG: hypothetical protein J5527_12370 [Treponema sp.]|nr:hypothetical protein [Treponema sp.]
MNKIKGIPIIIMSLFIYNSCTTTKKVGINKTSKIGNITFNYTHDNVDSWSNEDVINNSLGAFSLEGDGSTKLYEYILGTYAIKAKIKNHNEERDVCFIVDTGAQGNVISQNTLKTFGIAFEERFKFYNSYTYSPQANGKVKGVIIPEFIAEGFVMKDVLFMPSDVDDFGCLDDGTPVNGFLGMRILSELPLLFSAKDKKLIFFDNGFKPKGIEYLLEQKNAFVLEIPLTIENKRYLVKLDTGGNTNYIPYNLYKKMSKKIDGKIELRMSGLRRYMGLIDSMDFIGKECKNLPIVSQKNYMIIGLDNFVMLGETVLRNFDIYLDYKNSRLYLNPIEYDFPKHSMLLVYTSGGGNRYGYYGLNLIRDKYNHKLRVSSLYYQNNKKLCPEIKLGDYVLSINGINQQNFNLEDLQDYETVEMVLQHKKKVYTVNLDRKHFENCLEY